MVVAFTSGLAAQVHLAWSEVYYSVCICQMNSCNGCCHDDSMINIIIVLFSLLKHGLVICLTDSTLPPVPMTDGEHSRIIDASVFRVEDRQGILSVF